MKHESRGLYIVMLSIHGLVRGNDIELGRDADTGGQIQYVIEQARALARHPSVGRVDLLTRRVVDRRVDPEYAEREEMLGDGAHLIRIPCGPNRYLYKERLWPYLDGFVDNCLQHIKGVGRIPHVVHGHYADAGYVGTQLATLLGVPMIFTGHSLGRVKRQRLMDKGVDQETLERKYNLALRIEAEERALETAALVITSTTQEVEEQYESYEYYQPVRMKVNPPGVDLGRFSPARPGDPKPEIFGQIARFLTDPEKPMIFAMARADERKNFPALIEAYAGNEELRRLTNLVLVAGNRDDIRSLEPMTRRALSEILLMVDRRDLYGSVAYPKHHRPEDVPELYRLAAASGGVFVNPALTEPFGLTLIEAAASGLPIVATRDGGPRDIVRICRNGLLVDPLDPVAMGEAILKVVGDKKRWREFAENGVESAHQSYSWESHVQRYVESVDAILPVKRSGAMPAPSGHPHLLKADRMIISDIDNTLTGSDEESLRKLFGVLEENREHVAFSIATGRDVDSALEVLREIGAPTPEILITSVGTEIHYRNQAINDLSWERQIDYAWDPEGVKEVLTGVPGLYLQDPEHQRRFKLSFDYDPDEAPTLLEIRHLLRQQGLRVKPILSFEAYLDLIPIRASSGLAIRFLALKWGFNPDHLLVIGDSGNDEDMLRGETLGVVVGNYSFELEPLRGQPRIYFSQGHNAKGVLEGIEHYDFMNQIKVPEEESR